MTSEHQSKILLIEDSQEDVFFFKRALLKSGLKADVVVAGDGKEAIDILAVRAPEFDVIFLDLKLPKLNGFDVLKWVQAQEFQPPLCIFMLSGSGNERDKVLARELGVSDYLVKPATAEMLRECLAFVPPVS